MTLYNRGHNGRMNERIQKKRKTVFILKRSIDRRFNKKRMDTFANDDFSIK